MEKKFKLGLIRVVTITDEHLLNQHGRLLEQYYPQFSVESRCIEDQPTGIHDDETEALAVPKIIKLVKEWQDVDAVVISCAGDPAVQELRAELTIPVIGAGEATALLAQNYGKKFGVLGITEDVPRAYSRAFGANIVGTCRTEGVYSTLDLMTEKGRTSVVQKALELKELGAEVIALACTGMSTIEIAKELEDVCQIPVIDPVMAEGLVAYFECLRTVRSEFVG
ncbi:MAG: aspartate/glutamate racemase family protein [Desulfitobacterium hafniense]|nr:aspartate/glutamate racemase family protein [Desulfitobacterium hafniense]